MCMEHRKPIDVGQKAGICLGAGSICVVTFIGAVCIPTRRAYAIRTTQHIYLSQAFSWIQHKRKETEQNKD